MARRLVAAVRRGYRHLLGRHSLRASIGGAVAGQWMWRVDCTCAVLDHGAEPSRAAAGAAALAAVARHDDLTGPSHVFGTSAQLLWPDVPMLRAQLKQLTLPDSMRGDGSIVAADASRREVDGHAGWGFVTDAGWHQSGTVEFEGADVAGLELLAIAKALQVYPRGHRVDVLSDNLHARNMARRILSGRMTQWIDAPRWMPLDAFTLLHKTFKHAHLKVRVLEVKTKTHPLHNVADRLARGLSPADLLTPREDS